VKKTSNAAASSKANGPDEPPHVLIIVQNLPVPLDSCLSG